MSLKKLMPRTNVNHNIQKIKIMYNSNRISNMTLMVEEPVKEVRMFQEGGEAPMPEQAPQEGQGGSPEQMAQGIVDQIMQAVQDPNVIAMIAQMLMEAVQGGGQPQEAPAEQPAMKNGGVLNLKFAKGGLAEKMKAKKMMSGGKKMKSGGKAC